MSDQFNIVVSGSFWHGFRKQLFSLGTVAEPSRSMVDSTDKEIDSSEGLFGIQKQLP